MIKDYFKMSQYYQIEEAIASLSSIPHEWQLVGVKEKSPQINGKAWQERFYTRESIEDGLRSRKFDGYGVRLGKNSGYFLIALDIDGASVLPCLESEGKEMPKSPMSSSGKEGHYCVYVKLSEEQVKELNLSGSGRDYESPGMRKGEKIQIRCSNAQQQVLPPSLHPEKGAYYWLEGRAPNECELAEAPQWVIELLPKKSTEPSTETRFEYSQCISYLEAIKPETWDNYLSWLHIGQALKHHLGEDGLAIWDRYSQKGSKYEPGECEKKWQSFNKTGIAIATLGELAKNDGWVSPLKAHAEEVLEAAFRPIVRKAGRPSGSTTSGTKGEDKMSNEMIFASWFLEHVGDHLLYIGDRATWMLCDDESNIWQPTSESKIESIFINYLDENRSKDITARKISGALKIVRAKLHTDAKEFERKPNLIPFLNGLLDLGTKKMKDIEAADKISWQLPRIYDPEAKDWSGIDKFLSHLSSHEEAVKEILICYLAAIVRGMGDLQKYLHLIGIGGSGKGEFIKLASQLVGRENVHASKLDIFCSNNFEPKGVIGKALVIFDDADRLKVGMSNFVNLTGQGYLRGEEKGKQAFNFIYEGMVIVASNGVVFAGEQGNKIQRRCIMVECLKKPEVIVENLIDSVAHELPAFTTYILSLSEEYIREILKTTDRIASTVKVGWKAKTLTDSVAAFVEECLIYSPESSGLRIGKERANQSQLWGAYNTFCADSNLHVDGLQVFSKKLLDILSLPPLSYDVEKARRENGYIITNISFREKEDTNWHAPAPTSPTLNILEQKLACEALNLSHTPPASPSALGDRLT